MRLFIVRHGETQWNIEGRFQGQQDTDLNERGMAQGDRVASYLSGHKFDAVTSSPLKRALVTGKKIAAACGVKQFDVLPGLTEINHGDWEGLLSTEVSVRWPRIIDMWHRSPHTVIMPGDDGESLRSVQIRAVSAIDEISKKYQGDVCVAAHDAVIKVLLCYFLNTPLSSFWNFQIANCGLSIVEIKEGDAPRMSLMGDAHFLSDRGANFDLPEQKGL
ncbi:MAG: histidine phosphatase family protein [Synergistaceae bacterium]|jgi:probable phosphoglycerate mutase|nr:histidine phosphatase family protein [Synergistaceae bacterium]